MFDRRSEPLTDQSFIPGISAGRRTSTTSLFGCADPRRTPRWRAKGVEDRRRQDLRISRQRRAFLQDSLRHSHLATRRRVRPRHQPLLPGPRETYPGAVPGIKQNRTLASVNARSRLLRRLGCTTLRAPFEAIPAILVGDDFRARDRRGPRLDPFALFGLVCGGTLRIRHPFAEGAIPEHS